MKLEEADLLQQHSALFNSGHKNHHFSKENTSFLLSYSALLRTYSATLAREIDIFQGKNTFFETCHGVEKRPE